jgi:hypothetical protein
VLLTSFILSNPADASNISFTGSPDVLNGNSGGTFTQLFNGDGGAIASNPVVVDGRPVSSADLLLNELSTSGKVSTITFPDQDGELVAQNFGSGLGQGFLNLGNGQNKSGALDKPYIHNGGAGKTPINPSSPNASGVFGVPNHGTGAKPTSDLGRGFINVGRNPISNPSSAGNTTPRTPAADSTRGINTLYNFAGTGALTNFNPSGVNFTSSATANNLLNNLTQQGQKFFNDPLVQTAILNAAIGDTGKPINNQLTGNPQNNSSVVPVLGSTAILAGSGSGTSWLPSLAPLVQALGQYVPPVAAFGAAFFGNTQPAGEGSEIIPVGRMFDPSEFNQVGLNPNAFNQLGMGAIAAPMLGANPSNPLDRGISNISFNGATLPPNLDIGTLLPTLLTPNLNISPTLTAPALTPNGIANATDPFFTEDFFDPNSINWRQAPDLLPEREFSPSPSSQPGFNPNDVNRQIGQDISEILRDQTIVDKWPEDQSPQFFEGRRDIYMGKTPQKDSLIGSQVIERMKAEGTVRQNDQGQLEVLSEGKWYDINQTDMSHVIDAVTWWNSVGYKHGPRSEEVRGFMNDPNNYILEPSGPNRARGGSTQERYRLPE